MSKSVLICSNYFELPKTGKNVIFFFDIDHDRHKVVFYAIYVEHDMAVIEKKGLCVSIDFYSIQGLKGCTK